MHVTIIDYENQGYNLNYSDSCYNEYERSTMRISQIRIVREIPDHLNRLIEFSDYVRGEHTTKRSKTYVNLM